MKSDDTLVPVTLYLDPDLKEAADILFENLGMDLPGALRIFLRQSLEHGGLPFDVKLSGRVHQEICFLEAMMTIMQEQHKRAEDTVEEMWFKLAHARGLLSSFEEAQDYLYDHEEASDDFYDVDY